LEPLALARLIESGAYDRHLRQARRRYRARRDALVQSLSRHLPRARVTGVAAGLHAVVRLERAVDGSELALAALRRSLGVYPLGYAFMQPRPGHDQPVLGDAHLPAPGVRPVIRLLAQVLRA